MWIIGTALWVAVAILLVVAFLAIVALRGQGAGDYILDGVAMIILLGTGALFASAFVPRGWAMPIHDALTFGLGYNPQPKVGVYTPHPTNPAELDLPSVGADESWMVQLRMKPGRGGKVHLPADPTVQTIEVWTVDGRGWESLATKVK